MRQHRAKILVVEQQQALVVGELERDAQHAFLRVVQFQHPAEQHRPHLRDRRAHRMALLAEYVPEHRRRGTVGKVGDAEGNRPLFEFRVRRARLADPREVALYVGAEHRNALGGESLGEHLQGDGLAGAGGAGDQPVPVGELEAEPDRRVALSDQDGRVIARRTAHRSSPPLQRSI